MSLCIAFTRNKDEKRRFIPPLFVQLLTKLKVQTTIESILIISHLDLNLSLYILNIEIKLQIIYNLHRTKRKLFLRGY
jgi:hypothetical protein